MDLKDKKNNNMLNNFYYSNKSLDKFNDILGIFCIRKENYYEIKTLKKIKKV